VPASTAAEVAIQRSCRRSSPVDRRSRTHNATAPNTTETSNATPLPISNARATAPASAGLPGCRFSAGKVRITAAFTTTAAMGTATAYCHRRDSSRPVGAIMKITARNAMVYVASNRLATYTATSPAVGASIRPCPTSTTNACAAKPIALPNCPTQNNHPTRFRGYRDTINAPTAAPTTAPIGTNGNASSMSTARDSIGYPDAASINACNPTKTHVAASNTHPRRRGSTTRPAAAHPAPRFGPVPVLTAAAPTSTSIRRRGVPSAQHPPSPTDAARATTPHVRRSFPHPSHRLRRPPDPWMLGTTATSPTNQQVPPPRALACSARPEFRLTGRRIRAPGAQLGRDGDLEVGHHCGRCGDPIRGGVHPAAN